MPVNIINCFALGGISWDSHVTVPSEKGALLPYRFMLGGWVWVVVVGRGITRRDYQYFT